MPRKATLAGAGGRYRRPDTPTKGDSVAADQQDEAWQAAGKSWAARYGQVVVRDGMATVPWGVYAYQGALGLTAQEVWFISTILARKWNSDLPHPSLRKISEDSGVSLRQLQYLRAALCSKGFLEVVERKGTNGAQGANEYDFSGLFLQIDNAILNEPTPANPLRDEDEPVRTADASDALFATRYGRVLAGAGVVAVPSGIYTHQAALGLQPQHCWFTTYILAYKWTSDLPYPSLRRMAERTGYSIRRLHEIKDEMVAAGLLRLLPRIAANGARDANGYDFSPLLGKLVEVLQTSAAPQPAHSSRRSSQGMQNSATGGMQNSAPAGMQIGASRGMQSGSPTGGGTADGNAATEKSILGMQNSATGGMQNAAPGGMQNSATGGMQRSRLRGFSRLTTPKSPDIEANLAAGDASRIRGGDAEKLPGGDADRFTRRRKDQEDTNQEDIDSNQITRKNAYSPYIARVAQDFSVELDDADRWPSNVTQALHLWQVSELDENSFVELMQEARRRTRLYQGRQGGGLIANKMAYYFRVLSSLAQGDDPAREAVAVQPSLLDGIL